MTITDVRDMHGNPTGELRGYAVTPGGMLATCVLLYNVQGVSLGFDEGAYARRAMTQQLERIERGVDSAEVPW